MKRGQSQFNRRPISGKPPVGVTAKPRQGTPDAESGDDIPSTTLPNIPQSSKSLRGFNNDLVGQATHLGVQKRERMRRKPSVLQVKEQVPTRDDTITNKDGSELCVKDFLHDVELLQQGKKP